MYFSPKKRNLFMAKQKKVMKHYKHRKYYSKNKRNHLKIFGGCKKCCCISLLFVSHLVVCSCSHSEVKLLPSKEYLDQHDDIKDSRFNDLIKERDRYSYRKDIPKSRVDILSQKQTGKAPLKSVVTWPLILYSSTLLCMN